ncbi:MAG: MFS transporter, partial [Leeuwenhoekiella sp.]|nr:MFS transporter [Leeuwenhoekiella sp.]
ILKNIKSDDINNFSAMDEAAKALVRTSDLMAIRNPYVILGLVLIVVFILFLAIKMPQSKEQEAMPGISKTFSDLGKNKKYVLGVIAQILYIGAQIMCWTYIYQYAEAKGIDGVTAGYYQIVAFIVFTVGRILGTYLLRFISSGKLLASFAVLAVAFVIGVITSSGEFGLYCLVGISFCMSLMFPTIYGITLEDLTEEQSKVGSAGLVMAIVGGALMPKLQGMIIDAGGTGVSDIQILGVAEVNFSFILPLLCFVYISWYGFYISNKHEASNAVSSETLAV